LGSIYNISVRNKLEKVNTLHGIQKRLNMLGYNAGRVDGAIGPRTERAVLNFQADNDPLRIDGIPGPETQKTLKKVVGE
jgi:N-acetylmuramoyl-L-alanine amidase